jgi:hypothetical protein
VAAHLLHRRRVRAAPPITLCPSLCRHPAGIAAAAGGGRPCGAARWCSAAYSHVPLMDASAPAPSSAAVASAWPLTAAECSGMDLRATAAPAAALAHLDRTNRPCRPPQKAHLFLSWLCSDAPALMSAFRRTADGRGAPPNAAPSSHPCAGKAGEGSGGPEGTPTSVPVPSHTACGPKRTRTDGKRVCERTGTRKNPIFGRACMGTHPSWMSRSCPPSRSNFCMQHNYWTIRRGATG